MLIPTGSCSRPTPTSLQLVEETVELYQREGRPLPPPTTASIGAKGVASVAS